MESRREASGITLWVVRADDTVAIVKVYWTALRQQRIFQGMRHASHGHGTTSPLKGSI